MMIAEDVKKKIEDEFKAWEAVQYAGMDKAARQKLGAFFTPPVLSIRMLEKFDSVADKDVLDPACGAGGLLVAGVFAGADPKRVYGVELSPEIAKVCRRRLAAIGVPRHHIHVGNALDAASYEFPPSERTYSVGFAKIGGGLDVTVKVFDRATDKCLLDRTFSITKETRDRQAGNVHKLVSKFVEKEYEGLGKTDANINVLNKVFAKAGLEEI